MNEKQPLINDVLKKITEGQDLLSVALALYNNLKEIIPINRLGIANVSEDGHFFYSRINIGDSAIQLKENFRTPTYNSTLSVLLKNDKPRIIPNLREYLKAKPGSVSTRLILKEGMLSSLTFPLKANGKAIGLLFLSSKTENSYTEEHIQIIRRFSHILAIVLERAFLLEKLEKTQFELDLSLAQKEGIQEELQQLAENTPHKQDALPSLTWDQWQRKIIAQTLKKTKGRIYGSKGAAVILDLAPTTLQSKMKKLGIHRNTDI